MAHTEGVDGAPGTLQATVGEPEEAAGPDTDVALLAAGHPTITELRTVSAVPGLL
ncbi:hypothetical protein [Pseudonocardia pini]|uniref:hypothetical protein n=1 Tax=Pseudonocardia pini TaxID=2758030 RepID=UPI001C6900E8|nr:hypothetical protein [Pseudonocardia pini]